MRVVIINKSDARGGAAVVSRRLMHALRDAGADARMLVVEKLTDDEYVEVAASSLRSKLPFLLERLEVYRANGHNKSTLFKIDPASHGLPLWNHPLVKSADVVLLNWVNQGMLSLDGIARIAASKPTVWTMHDLWCATGICHHPGRCNHFEKECGKCPLLGKKSSFHDLSYRIHYKKIQLELPRSIHYVAVSSWLEEKCRQSSLLKDGSIHRIPNAFRLPDLISAKPSDNKLRIVMAAARLDDDVKGLPIFIEALKLLEQLHKNIADRIEVFYCGDIRDSSLLQQTKTKWQWLGAIPQDKMAQVYTNASIVVSSSRYETLPGTLVEGQAYGALPVAFDRGGQRDIIDPGTTGIIAPFGQDDTEAASNLAKAIVEAVDLIDNTDSLSLLNKLRKSVEEKFSAAAIANQYISLIKSISGS